MDILYIPGLEEGGGTQLGDRYRLLSRTPEGGEVLLADRAVTRIELKAGEPLTLVLPPEVRGAARDFFVRLVAGESPVPPVTFAAPPGESVSFEDVTDSVFVCEPGINIFAFTETEQGVFEVNRKGIDVNLTVAFDPCGGLVPTVSRYCRIGAPYGTLPVPVRSGYSFVGWYTESEGGSAMTAESVCSVAVKTLYAHWEAVEDPYASYICAAGNLRFASTSAKPWTVDTTSGSTSPGSAKSGRIGNDESTVLATWLNGPGRLSFKYRVSSEENWDKLIVSVDGVAMLTYSGERGWTSASLVVTGAGTHAVEFAYVKDDSDREGSDCCWIDDVVWTEGGT